VIFRDGSTSIHVLVSKTKRSKSSTCYLVQGNMIEVALVCNRQEEKNGVRAS
jgi:hypothetical protein